MPPVFLHSRIKLKYGQLGAFNEAMAKVKPIVGQRGWRLVGAWSTVIGNLNEVHDIWEIEDANAVGAVMSSAFSDPEFRAVAAQFAAQIDEETLTVLTKTPYSS
jgi:NIPSNAP